VAGIVACGMATDLARAEPCDKMNYRKSVMKDHRGSSLGASGYRLPANLPILPTVHL